MWACLAGFSDRPFRDACPEAANIATTYHSAQIRAGLSRIRNAVSSSAWFDPALSCCLEEMDRGLNDCMGAFERCIQELELEDRRK